MSGFYYIPVRGIKEGHHSFEFDIRKEFFELFEVSEIKEGELTALATLERFPSHIDLEIKISGFVRISCDRCLEMFNQPVECENRLLVKFGHEPDNSDPDIITLPFDENELDLKQYIYEFIHLALPIQRFHPDDDTGESTCNPAMIQKLKEHMVDEEKLNDPRWEELERLVNDN